MKDVLSLVEWFLIQLAIGYNLQAAYSPHQTKPQSLCNFGFFCSHVIEISDSYVCDAICRLTIDDNLIKFVSLFVPEWASVTLMKRGRESFLG